MRWGAGAPEWRFGLFGTASPPVVIRCRQVPCQTGSNPGSAAPAVGAAPVLSGC